MIDILFVFLDAFLSIFNMPLFSDTFNDNVITVTLGSVFVFITIILIIFSLAFKTSKGGGSNE